MKTLFSKWMAIAVVTISSLFSAHAQVGAGTNLFFNLSGAPTAYGMVPSTAALSITNQITVEAWVSLSGFAQTASVVQKFGGCAATGEGGYMLHFTYHAGGGGGYTPQFLVADSCNSYDFVRASGDIAANTWTHLAGVWDGANLLIYINGNLAASAPCTRNPKAGNTPLYLGGTGSQSSDFAGSLDEVRIWNVARTQTQIQTFMNYTVSSGTANLVAAWRFDEGGTSTNTLDSSGNGHTMSLVNYPTVTRALSTAPIDILTFDPLNVTSTSAALRGQVNTKGVTAGAYYEYGTTPGLGTVTTSSALTASTSPQIVSIPVSGLTASTVYYYRLVVTNFSGGLITNFAGSFNFVTAGPPLIGAINVSNIGSTYAQLNTAVRPTTNQSATVYFQYSTNLSYGNVSSTVVVPFTNAYVSVNIPVTGLLPQTTYNYRAVATNSMGTTFSTNGTFTTPVHITPTVTTLPALNIAGTSATLVGKTVPNMAPNGFFQYGLTTNLGTTINSATPFTNVSLNFNSANSDHVTVTNPDAFAINYLITLEAWIYPTSNKCNTVMSRGSDFIFNVGFDGTNCGVTMKVALFFSGAWHFSTGTVPLNTWSHVAVSFSGAQGRKQIFINGVLDRAVTGLGGALPSSAQPWLIGAQSPNFHYFHGNLREVAVWNSERNQGQIANSMNYGPVGNEADLMAYYPLYERSGTVINDVTGKGNLGTFVNSPTWSTLAPATATSFFSQPVTGLTANTNYYFRAGANDGVGNGFGSIWSFLTASGSAIPFSLKSPTILGNGAFRFTFTNTPGTAFTVRGTTNVGLPLSSWPVLNAVVESPAGSFQFTDTNAVSKKFYKVSSP